MKTNEIFTKAMQKAVKNGYKGSGWGAAEKDLNLPIDTITFIIFFHDFAKAFWGVETWCFGWNTETEALTGKHRWGWFPPNRTWPTGTSLIMGRTAWQYHLQQMILEKEPLKYLERYWFKTDSSEAK